MPFVRTVTTASGATAVQLVHKEYGQNVVIKHFGSAHSHSEEMLLREEASQYLNKDQPSLFDAVEPEILTLTTVSLFLFTTLETIYSALQFDTLNDEVFKKLVIARLVEPTSKLDSIRVLQTLGVKPPSNSLIHKTLRRIIERDYRFQLSTLCLKASQPEHLSLLLYDVTTLYFEVQKEDDFRKSGLSKERRLEPQVIVGLLVDRSGFPLDIHEFSGNMAESKTIIPVVTTFCQKHHLKTTNITITADAGMLSSKNLVELEQAGLSFIVGSRIAKTPYQIKEFKKSQPEESLFDGQIFEMTQSFGYRTEEKVKRRVIYQYKHKRAQLDLSNIDKQVAKAKRIMAGQAPLKKAIFLTLTQTRPTLNQSLIEEHRLKAGIKGYVTNLPLPNSKTGGGVPAQEIIAAYHQLFQVEKSFRMSKSDLKARPIFHRKQDSIRAHLTIVFAALAVAQYIEERSQISIKRFIQKLIVLRTATVLVNGNTIQANPKIPSDVENLLEKIEQK